MTDTAIYLRKKRWRMRRGPRPACRVPGCGKPSVCIRDGLRMTHYQQERRRRIRNDN